MAKKLDVLLRWQTLASERKARKQKAKASRPVPPSVDECCIRARQSLRSKSQPRGGSGRTLFSRSRPPALSDGCRRYVNFCCARKLTLHGWECDPRGWTQDGQSFLPTEQALAAVNKASEEAKAARDRQLADQLRSAGWTEELNGVWSVPHWSRGDGLCYGTLRQAAKMQLSRAEWQLSRDRSNSDAATPSDG